MHPDSMPTEESSGNSLASDDFVMAYGGGPAFPHHVKLQPSDTSFHYHGMTVRDWFAGQALPAVVSSLAQSNGSFQGSMLTDLFGPTATNIRREQIAAALAYSLADAMLARRDRSI